MARLEEIKAGALVRGLMPSEAVKVLHVAWFGTDAVEVTFRDGAGRNDSRLLYRDQEPNLSLESPGVHWAFDGDGHALKLLSEAHRIRLAHLFDPYLAVHTSLLMPLPHQITAVYGEMLRRQPLRFLLADDPGAGKTIMTGLLIKELLQRGDLERCLIVSPGSLVEQWQDELWDRFHLDFSILGREGVSQSRDGDPFRASKLLIARLDMLSRDEDLQRRLKPEGGGGVDWDLVVVDEAHKCSAHFQGSDVKATKRYRLAQLLGSVTRHLLFLTATPHNGKEDDFALFMALVDSDRFQWHPKASKKAGDVSDLMRRLSKENLYKFDGTPLFPERKAYTVRYPLSPLEAELYAKVTAYVREEMNRADRLQKGKRAIVGFALTSLQRRLASSPEAILRSLERRTARLEKRIKELLDAKMDLVDDLPADLPVDFESDEVEEDMDEASSGEMEDIEEEVLDRATAAQTIQELKAEIATLCILVELARRVRASGTDKKWEELSRILQDEPEMYEGSGTRRKLVLFSEHRDTVNYLAGKIRGMLGKPEAVAVIHGGLDRQERRRVQGAFTQDKSTLVLVATDAAGEGINLQRAHLMVNYDLPWNPNRLEQRFGRIHRIGQDRVCHLWNLVADGTREGEVYLRLLEKLSAEKDALNGQVFDVLGKIFEGDSLRDLLLEAIRFGDDPARKENVLKKIDAATEMEHVLTIWKDNALTPDSLNQARVLEIRTEMERLEARRLQPHFISIFFREAFKRAGGRMRERESGRYEIAHVPSVLRKYDSRILDRYERVTFEKEKIQEPGRPLAEFLCPGHPLLNAVIHNLSEREGDLLRRGAILVDPQDDGDRPRLLFYFKSEVQNALPAPGDRNRVISERMQFVEMDGDGNCRGAGYAPYLSYDPLPEEKRGAVLDRVKEFLRGGDPEERAMRFAVTHLIPDHLREVEDYLKPLLAKTADAVRGRLTKEIAYWDRKANELKEKELAGKKTGMGSGRARGRADELEVRLGKRLGELALEERIHPRSPVVLGGALIIPKGLLDAVERPEIKPKDTGPKETREVERLAMEAVLEVERRLGRQPRDVSAEKVGWDIESVIPCTGRLLLIEVKGRVKGAMTVTVTKNEILMGLNKPEAFVLALVEVEDGRSSEPRYVRQPFQKDLDFGVASVNYNLKELLLNSEAPG